jgi:hypothetical protein
MSPTKSGSCCTSVVGVKTVLKEPVPLFIAAEMLYTWLPGEVFTKEAASMLPVPAKSPITAGKIPKIAPFAAFRPGLKKPMFVGAAAGGAALFLAAETLARALRLLVVAGLRWLSKPRESRDANTTRTRREADRLFILFIGTPS